MIMLFLLLNFLFPVYGQLKDVQVQSDKNAYELELLIAHLKKEVKDPVTSQTVLDFLGVLNQDLMQAKRQDALFLIKAELYRSILNYDLNQNSSLLINELFLKSIEEKLKKFNLTYSDFIQWMIKAMISDLRPYMRKNLTANEEQLEARELKKILKFVGPWLITFDKLPPESFVNLVTQVGVDALRILSHKTYFYSIFKVGQTDQPSPLFILPTVQIPAPPTPPSESEVPPPSENNTDAVPQETLEEVTTPEDLSPLSEEIDKIAPKESPSEGDVWIPD